MKTGSMLVLFPVIWMESVENGLPVQSTRDSLLVKIEAEVEELHVELLTGAGDEVELWLKP